VTARDGKTLRPGRRVARFGNFPELRHTLRASADGQTAVIRSLPRRQVEGGEPIVIARQLPTEHRARPEDPGHRYQRPGGDNCAAKKQASTGKVRSDQSRVFHGSTQKKATRTNGQKRPGRPHHPAAPWKPAEVEQRDGRTPREGNENAAVAIYRYVTEGS